MSNEKQTPNIRTPSYPPFLKLSFTPFPTPSSCPYPQQCLPHGPAVSPFLNTFLTNVPSCLLGSALPLGGSTLCWNHLCQEQGFPLQRPLQPHLCYTALCVQSMTPILAPQHTRACNVHNSSEVENAGCMLRNLYAADFYKV